VPTNAVGSVIGGLLVNRACQAEINHFNVIVRGDQNILWLDVTMDDPAGVRVRQRQRIGNLERIPRPPFFVKRPGKARPKWRTLHGIPLPAMASRRSCHIVNSGDVWMAERRRRPGLAQESRPAFADPAKDRRTALIATFGPSRVSDARYTDPITALFQFTVHAVRPQHRACNQTEFPFASVFSRSVATGSTAAFSIALGSLYRLSRDSTSRSRSGSPTQERSTKAARSGPDSSSAHERRPRLFRAVHS